MTTKTVKVELMVERVIELTYNPKTQSLNSAIAIAVDTNDYTLLSEKVIKKEGAG